MNFHTFLTWKGGLGPAPKYVPDSIPFSHKLSNLFRSYCEYFNNFNIYKNSHPLKLCATHPLIFGVAALDEHRGPDDIGGERNTLQTTREVNQENVMQQST